MYTIINKHLRIQVFYKGVYTSPSYESIQRSINAQEIPDRVRLLIGKVADQAKETVEKDLDLEKELDAYKIKDLKKFFFDYPHAWGDIKRKLHKYRTSRGEKYGISKADEGEIYSIFLRSHRQEGAGELLNNAIPREILKNSELIEHASASVSLLDTSYLDIQRSEKNISDKGSFIGLLIRKGLSENTGVSRRESPALFSKIFPRIHYYLISIFHMNLSEMGISPDESLESLEKKIVHFLWNEGTEPGNGLKAKNAWMIVKAFHAWGSLEEITKARDDALKQVENLSHMLLSSGIQVSNPHQYTDKEGNTSFSGDIIVTLPNGERKDAHITYRVKSLESLLVKLWADEDYTNTDALRDMIGGAIYGDFGGDQKNKAELIYKISDLYANRGYLYKDKGGFGNESDLSEPTYKSLKSARKRPLSQSKNRDAYSSAIVRNISLSGFMQYGNIPIGTEFQFFDTLDFNAWKAEHPEYHPRRILRAWARGQDFVTPRQTIMTYYTHRKPTLDRDGLRKLIINQITENHIIPYFIDYNDSHQVIFALGKAEKNLLKRFPSAQKIDRPLEDKELVSFIDTICTSVSGATPAFSLQTPLQDQGGQIEV